MMLSVKGRFKDGSVQLLEPVEGHDGQEVIVTFPTEDGDEETLYAEMRAASRSAIQEYWNNDEDAAYDKL